MLGGLNWAAWMLHSSVIIRKNWLADKRVNKSTAHDDIGESNEQNDASTDLNDGIREELVIEKKFVRKHCDFEILQAEHDTRSYPASDDDAAMKNHCSYMFNEKSNDGESEVDSPENLTKEQMAFLVWCITNRNNWEDQCNKLHDKDEELDREAANLEWLRVERGIVEACHYCYLLLKKEYESKQI